MPIDVDLDHIRTLECEEHLGNIISLTRLVRCFNVPGTDPSMLLNALNAVGLTFGSNPGLASPGSVDPYSSLVLTRRNATITEGDPRIADVTLKYEHLLAGANQALLKPAGGIIYTKGKCSVREKDTNFFYPYGITSGTITVDDRGDPIGNGKPAVKQFIQVAYRYPLTPIENERPGELFYQVGQIKLPFPEKNVQFEGVITLGLFIPDQYADRFIAHINSKPWKGKPAFTWLCTEVSWQLLRADTGTYKFGFEFQYNSDTWNPDIAFKDNRTNLPPSGAHQAGLADPNTGVINQDQDPLTGLPIAGIAWSVPALPAIDFNAAFAAVFEGDIPPIFQ